MLEKDLASELVGRVSRFIKEKALIRPGEKVLAAVSAGLDSMVLLDILFRLSVREGFSLTAAHFDHRLRGEQSRAEGELVRKRCESLEVPFVSGAAEVGVLAAIGRMNLQNAARLARYSFLWDCADRLACDRLATGHHRDDQAETVLMRLLSGSSLFGLAGIQPSSRSGCLIRPLLVLSRSELEHFAALNEIPYAEDPSNLSDKYLRNRLRHKVIPGIEQEYDPHFTDNLVSLAEEASILCAALEERVNLIMDQVVIKEHDGVLKLDCSQAAQTPALLRRYLIRRTVLELSSQRVILSGRPLNAVERLILKGPSGGRLDLPGGLTVMREFNTLVIREKMTPGIAPEMKTTKLEAEDKKSLILEDSQWEIALRVKRYDGGSPGQFSKTGGAGGVFQEGFDSDLLKFPLSAGAWRAGENMRPFGLGGTKKLKKLFGEKRIPASQRSKLPVFRDSEGEVLWVCGVARSEIAPLSAGTKKILIIQARRS
ncbi:MAG TPA: tRNA lysidine(34) synthetase TilS [archaeon]|nr:tRNA lysidine(34) synthetase TilS [archaeon]